MRTRVLALALTIGIMAPATSHASNVDVALGLGAFTALSQLITMFKRDREVIIIHPGAVHGYWLPPAGAPQRPPDVIYRPGGRFLLEGDGRVTPFRWVWVPDPPDVPQHATPNDPCKTAASRGGITPADLVPCQRL